MCKMSGMEVQAKWGLSFQQPSSLDKAIITTIPNGSTAVLAIQTLYCGVRVLTHRPGIHSFSEVKKGNTAFVIWRDDGLNFHSLDLVKEGDHWKVDFLGLI